MSDEAYVNTLAAGACCVYAALAVWAVMIMPVVL